METTETKPKEASPVAAATPEPVAPAVQEEEKQTNCLGCNKPIKKIKRYYRDGKFYCDKKCWRKFIKEQQENKEEKK